MEALTLYTDGASRGNPGEAGIGFLILGQEGEVVRDISRYIGRTTNNVAEYKALIAGLEEVNRLSSRRKTSYRVLIKTDSELIMKQLTGEFRVRDRKLIPLSIRAMRLLKRLGGWKFKKVSRKENKRADNLANLAIDRRLRNS